MNPYFFTFRGFQGGLPPLVRDFPRTFAGPGGGTLSSDETSAGRRTSRPDHARSTGPALDAHYRFVTWLVPSVERFPRGQKFLLGDRMRTTALDVLERLIEATYTKRRGDPLARANLGLEKLRFLVRLARDRRCLDHPGTNTPRAAWARLGARSARGARRSVPRKARDLFDGIASFSALLAAVGRAARF